MRAECQCGDLAADVGAGAEQVVACHCRACQRRSGSPFGVIAYFDGADVTLHGRSSAFARTGTSGKPFISHFCPRCGTTVWVRSGGKPDAIGIPVGLFADPAFPAPIRSVWEETQHHWVAIPGAIAHFPRGRT
jgi:hypothetical protein